jgi:nucleoside-diphosphate-sugar epimerase
VNVDGSRNVAELAERCAQRGDGLERLSYVSTAYVAGTTAASSGRTSSTSGRAFAIPTSGRSSRPRRCCASGPTAPLQVLRPSIVVGDRRTGPTSSFNVLYGPLKAFARGKLPAIPGRRSSPVDIVPVDYVADAVHELERGGRHVPPRSRRQRHHPGAPLEARVAPPAKAPAAGAPADGLPPDRPSPASAPLRRASSKRGLLPVLRRAGAFRRPPLPAGASRSRATSIA